MEDWSPSPSASPTRTVVVYRDDSAADAAFVAGMITLAVALIALAVRVAVWLLVKGTPVVVWLVIEGSRALHAAAAGRLLPETVAAPDERRPETVRC